MKKLLVWLLNLVSESKKVRALVASLLALALVPLAKRLGMELTDMQIQSGVALVVAYLIGQGWADNGKEAVKEAAKLGVTLPPK